MELCHLELELSSCYKEVVPYTAANYLEGGEHRDFPHLRLISPP